MEFDKVGGDALKILSSMKDWDLKPDEKIAALDAAANIIRVTLAAETLKLMYHNILGGKK